MVKLYDLTKRGTIILTIGRSGSHLLGDIVEQTVKTAHPSVVNLKEHFLINDHDFSVNKEFRSRILIAEHLQEMNYLIIQIQDFASKLWFLNHLPDWFKDYHVIILRRRDKVSHFFSRQVLLNFWDQIPIHAIRGVDNGTEITFENLRDKKAVASVSKIWQFYAELLALDIFEGDETVYYEDMLTWPETGASLYLKNPYPVSYEELFENYHDVVRVLKNE